MKHHLTFYLDQRYVGECEITFSRTFFSEVAGYAHSLHYICPHTGRIWASIQVDTEPWRAELIPAPGQPKTWSSFPGAFNLDWYFGDIYENPLELAKLPAEVLRLELEAQIGRFTMENNR